MWLSGTCRIFRESTVGCSPLPNEVVHSLARTGKAAFYLIDTELTLMSAGNGSVIHSFQVTTGCVWCRHLEGNTTHPILRPSPRLSAYRTTTRFDGTVFRCMTVRSPKTAMAAGTHESCGLCFCFSDLQEEKPCGTLAIWMPIQIKIPRRSDNAPTAAKIRPFGGR